jgi:hypothetical protein
MNAELALKKALRPPLTEYLSLALKVLRKPALSRGDSPIYQITPRLKSHSGQQLLSNPKPAGALELPFKPSSHLDASQGRRSLTPCVPSSFKCFTPKQLNQGTPIQLTLLQPTHNFPKLKSYPTTPSVPPNSFYLLTANPQGILGSPLSICPHVVHLSHAYPAPHWGPLYRCEN